MQLSRKVIPNNQVGEKEYRALKDRLSYSGLKQYVQSRSKFYKEMILQESVKKEQTLSTILGDMVHVLLAEQVNEWDSKFVLSSVNPPTGQVLTLVQELYKRSLQSMDENGMQKDNFNVIFTDTVQVVKYEYDGITEKAFKGKTNEKILEMFQATGEVYYQELLKSTGKTVVTIQQIEQAERLVTMLKEHEYTRDIVNLKSSEGVEVFNELVVLYEIDNIKYRSMIDKIIIDHTSKHIKVIDYKTTWSPETGWEYTYLQNQYYIQVGLYQIAMEHWCKEHDLVGYTITPMLYIAIDTTGNSAPVLYQMTSKDILMGQRSFTVRGKHYIGVLETHKNIQWNLASGNWQTSMDIAKNNGVVEMKLVYR